MIHRDPEQSRHFYKSVKRVLDVGGALILLLITSPFMIAAAGLIRMSMGSPVLFKQRRGGYLGREFLLYKFRTMTKACDESGKLLPISRRSTPIGRMIRRLSIDELPQLWSVLRGDMSLIGPRPLLASYLPRYNSFQRRRHEVRPGLTGWAQVSGRNALTWEDKFDLDVWYVDNVTVGLDFGIVLRTIWSIWNGRGVADIGSPSEYEFMGTSEASSLPKTAS